MAEPFIFSNGQTAHNAEDLIRLCKQFPNDSIGYLIREDFEKWLSYIGANNIAQYATEARQAEVSDNQKLDLLLAKLQPQPETKPQAKPEVKAESQSEIVSASIEKPKVSFFTAIATFFIVLFDRKSKTEDRPLNS